jgi:hypothetical protein
MKYFVSNCKGQSTWEKVSGHIWLLRTYWIRYSVREHLKFVLTLSVCIFPTHITLTLTLKDEAQTALFKDPVRTAL